MINAALTVTLLRFICPVLYTVSVAKLISMVNRLARVKYVVSHIPYETSRMISNVKKNLSVRYFGYVSNVVLMVALCLGLYTRWTHNEDMAILVIAFLGLFVFAISCALIYYFSMEEIGFSLSRLWIGCLLGVVSA